jgi:two-component system, LytTR family, response regulator LytT
LQRVENSDDNKKQLIDNQEDKKILIKMGNQVKVIEFQQVAYFYSQEKLTFATLPDGKKYPINYSLEHLENVLSPTVFFRANRQFIINRNAIASMQIHTKSRLRLHLQPTVNEEVIVSTERTRILKDWLKN